jgi:integrase
MACIRKRRGKYVIDFYDNQGKRRWKTLPKDARKKDANKALRDIEDLLEKGVYVSSRETPTFKQVAEDWIASKRQNLRSTTWEVYEGHTKNHFNELEPLKINRISIARIEKFIQTRQERGMKLGTLRKILVSLNQIMSYAVRHKYIDHNPVRDAERPRGQGREEDNKITILSVEEIQSFLEQVTDKEYHTLFMLAITTGARQGELLGLKWSDIDCKNSQIHIQRTFNKGRWFAPKTKGSERRIDIGPSMVKALKEWKLACLPNKHDLIFPNRVGQPINYSNMVNRVYLPALKAAGIARIKFHALRHTTASLMIEQGENIKYIQSQLGHSSPTVTLNVYAHLMKPINQEAACRLESAIFDTSGSKMVAVK